MKNFLLGSITTLAFLVIFGFYNEPKGPDTPEKEWVISPRFLKLQEGITKEEARKWLEKDWLPIYRNYPGWNAMLGEPLGGTANNNIKEKADFVLVYFFDTKALKDHYFPDGHWGDDVKKVVEENQSAWDDLFGKYFDHEKYQNEEYLMFASSK